MYPLRFSLKEDDSSTSTSNKTRGLSLSSSLNSGVYNLCSSSTSKQEQITTISSLATNSKSTTSSKVDELLKKSSVPIGIEQLHALPTGKSRRALKKLRKSERSKTKGSGWFDLPATELTEERKRDLELLQMRSVLDNKHFYKGTDSQTLPKYFQIGKIVDSAAEFYDRIPVKERKQTLVDELLNNAETVSKLKKQQQRDAADKRRKGQLPAYRHMKRLKKKKK